MISERFDVVVVPFPFDDLPVTKRRPAVVLSNNAFNEMNGNTVFAMVTTARKTGWPSDVPILELAPAGLKTPCVIRLRLRTLPNELIVGRIGRLGSRDRDTCQLVLQEALQ